jgi:hypothetical protein
MTNDDHVSGPSRLDLVASRFGRVCLSVRPGIPLPSFPPGTTSKRARSRSSPAHALVSITYSPSDLAASLPVSSASTKSLQLQNGGTERGEEHKDQAMGSVKQQ